MVKKVLLNLKEVESSLKQVERNWSKIEKELIEKKLGKKRYPLDAILRQNMMSAYEHLNFLLENRIEPFSQQHEMFELNNRVHYGTNYKQRYEFNSAIQNSLKKFKNHISPLSRWYEKHKERKDNPLKISAEIYVGILGYPQLFVEGNHRTGSMISSWIDMYYGYAPFILSSDNAISYFEPSAEIKKFADKSTWRGRWKLPKYRKSFKEFWEDHIEERYVIRV